MFPYTRLNADVMMLYALVLVSSATSVAPAAIAVATELCQDGGGAHNDTFIQTFESTFTVLVFMSAVVPLLPTIPLVLPRLLPPLWPFPVSVTTSTSTAGANIGISMITGWGRAAVISNEASEPTVRISSEVTIDATPSPLHPCGLLSYETTTTSLAPSLSEDVAVVVAEIVALVSVPENVPGVNINWVRSVGISADAVRDCPSIAPRNARCAIKRMLALTILTASCPTT